MRFSLSEVSDNKLTKELFQMSSMSDVFLPSSDREDLLLHSEVQKQRAYATLSVKSESFSAETYNPVSWQMQTRRI